MIDRVVISGSVTVDGATRAVDTNVWIVGDDREVVVIDAAHDPAPIVAAIDGRRVLGIVATHGYGDHVNAGTALADATGAPIHLHPADGPLWSQVHPDRRWDRDLVDGEALLVAGHRLKVRHTPGHTPGGVCLYDDVEDAVFTADTLARSGPVAEALEVTDRRALLSSIRHRLLHLPPYTTVHPAHGEVTTIGAEALHLQEWLDRFG